MAKVLVIGLGSMGKRRIRNLGALGISAIAGMDLRRDRREEVAKLYGIETYPGLEEALENGPFDCWIISLPPDIHHVYMRKALDLKIPCFVEASVLDTDFDAMALQAEKEKVLIAPSCTLYFHPAVRQIKDFLERGYLGTITNIIYHSGQYLPDWHTYESVSDYYVSNSQTGGAREIIPFELTWLTLLLGFPEALCGIFKKTIDIQGAESIDDTYNALLDYGSFILNLNVDVVSRYATRRLTVNGSDRQLIWSWDEGVIKVFDPSAQQWQMFEYGILPAQEGYNKNITEQMYIDELGAFFQAMEGEKAFPNSLKADKEVLGLLYRIEESYKSKRFISG